MGTTPGLLRLVRVPTTRISRSSGRLTSTATDRRRPGLRRDPLDVENQNHSAIDFSIGPTGIQADFVFFEGTFTEDFGPDYFGDSAGGSVTSSWNAEVAIPLSSCAIPRRIHRTGPSRSTATYPRDRNYRSPACAFRTARAISLQLGDGRGDHRPPAARALGARTLRRDHGYEVLRGRSPGRRQHHDTRPGRPRREVASRMPNRSSMRRRSRLLPDRGRHGADLGRRRFALLYRRSVLVPRARRPAATRSRRSTHDHHRDRSGARGHGQGRRHQLHRARRGGRGRGHGRHPGPMFSTPRLRTPSGWSASLACARISAPRSPGSCEPAAMPITRKDGGGYDSVLGGDFLWRPAADVVTRPVPVQLLAESGSGPISTRLARPETVRLRQDGESIHST